jgi:hypothetical protein
MSCRSCGKNRKFSSHLFNSELSRKSPPETLGKFGPGCSDILVSRPTHTSEPMKQLSPSCSGLTRASIQTLARWLAGSRPAMTRNPKPAELRAFAPLSLVFWENTVSVVVQGVSSEPVSPDFPVKQGKNREFSRIWPADRRLTWSKRLDFRNFSAKFPKRRNREIIYPNRE